MHIPDGYLSPVTCGVMYATAIPFWAVAVNRVRKDTDRTVPYRCWRFFRLSASY